MDVAVELEPLVTVHDPADADHLPVDLDGMPLVLQDLIRSYLPSTIDLGAQADDVESLFTEDAESRTRRRILIVRLVLVFLLCADLVLLFQAKSAPQLIDLKDDFTLPVSLPSPFGGLQLMGSGLDHVDTFAVSWLAHWTLPSILLSYSALLVCQAREWLQHRALRAKLQAALLLSLASLSVFTNSYDRHRRFLFAEDVAALQEAGLGLRRAGFPIAVGAHVIINTVGCYLNIIVVINTLWRIFDEPPRWPGAEPQPTINGWCHVDRPFATNITGDFSIVAGASPFWYDLRVANATFEAVWPRIVAIPAFACGSLNLSSALFPFLFGWGAVFFLGQPTSPWFFL